MVDEIDDLLTDLKKSKSADSGDGVIFGGVSEKSEKKSV